MKRLLRASTYILAFLLPILLVGIIGIVFTHTEAPQPELTDALAEEIEQTTPAYDANRPTVAILMGETHTEVTDFLVPYELFNATDAFNVYSVASQAGIHTATGGLSVVTDYTLTDLDARLGKSPDIIVIPAIYGVDDSMLEWIRHHAAQGTTIFSICAGASTLAATGLVDGRQATTHWANMLWTKPEFPNVEWQTGTRYVVDGNIISSAGITSGIDASLYLIKERLGDADAERIANELHYPSYHYVANPQVPQFTFQSEDAIYLLNMMYRWDQAQAGVLLYDGVDEFALASIFDTYPASNTTQLLPVAAANGILVTRHGLRILPSWNFAQAPAMERLLVPGVDAPTLAESDLTTWAQQRPTVEIAAVHTDDPDRFVFDTPLLDLAQQQNVPTAAFGAKRLEYRPTDLSLAGADAFDMTLRPLLIGLIGLLVWYGVQAKPLRRRTLIPIPA